MKGRNCLPEISVTSFLDTIPGSYPPLPPVTTVVREAVPVGLISTRMEMGLWKLRSQRKRYATTLLSLEASKSDGSAIARKCLANHLASKSLRSGYSDNTPVGKYCGFSSCG